MRSDKKVTIALIAILILSAFILVIPVSADDADSGVSSSGHRQNLVRSPSTFQAFDRSPPHAQDSRMTGSSEDGALIQGPVVQGAKVGAVPGYVDDIFLLPWAAYAVPDVTCDNISDVLVNTIQYSEEGDLTKQRVIAKRGTNGSHLWEEEAPGEAVNMEAHGVLDWDWYWYWHWYWDWDGAPWFTDWYWYWTEYRGEDPYIFFEDYGYSMLANENRDWPWAWDWYWDWYWNWDGNGYDDWYIYSKHAPGMADMNCDGKGDVLVLLNEYDEEWYTTKATVIAKNGTTGAHLWEENVTGDDVRMWAYGVPDMSCDGKTDVLVKTGELNLTNDTGTYTVIAKNGTNGEHLWEEPFPFTFDGYHWLDVWADGVPDMSCDGKTDVLVKTYEWEYDGGWLLNNATIIAKNGTDGTHLWQENFTRNLESDDYLWVDAYAFPDMNCDNKTDVLVTEYYYDHSWGETYVTIYAFNGMDGTLLWDEPVGFYADESWLDLDVYAYGVPDLSCDGKTDVLVRIHEYDWEDWETYNVTILALNGTNGDVLWSGTIVEDGYEEDRWFDVYAYGVPDLNDDGKTDVLVKFNVSEWYEDELWLVGVGIGAYDGTDGSELWYEPIFVCNPPGQWCEDIWCDVHAHGVPDMNGDDKTDMLVTIYKYWWDDEWWLYEVTIIAKNGTDGAHLWEENITSDEYIWVDDIYSVPDMNGDNKTDVFVMFYDYDWYTDEITVRLIVKNGTNGEHLWEENITSDEEEELWVRGGVTPDIDGDGKPDVLVSALELNTTTGGVTNTVIAKKGTNGTHLWEESLSSVIAATGGGATFEPDKGTFCEPLTAINASELPPGAIPLPPVNFSHGFFSFTICGLENGTTVNVTITLPGPVPVGVQYWKYGPTLGDPTDHWYQLPVFDDDGDNVIIIQLTDGGLGDDDLTANGVIVDDGGPGTPRAAAAERVPVLTPLGIAALVGLLSILTTSTLSKKRKKR